MREIFKISALVAAFFAMLALVSCSKTGPAAEEYAEDEKIAIEVRVNAGAEVTVKSNQGNAITSLKVWGYEITGDNNSPAPDALPAVFGEFNGGSGTIHMLASCVGKTYRFMAVANETLFGQMYKARENYGEEEPLALNSHLTYKELSTAVFDASAGNDGIFKSFPNGDSPASMPFSHWTDVTITAETASIPITVFRPVAKAQLFANLTNTNDGILLIESASIKSAHNFAVPNEGFLFSSANANDLPDTQITKIPAYWGEYNDLTVSVPNISLKNKGDEKYIYFDGDGISITNETNTFVGSTFLYENNNGEDWSTASHTSTDAYDYGAYYMEINYSYGSNEDFTNGTEKIGTNYIPLPATIRNRDYKINATFDISRGLINVAFTVSDWEQTDIESEQSGANGSGDDVQDVVFAYPTFEIWPVKTIPDTNPAEYDYSQPVARYHATNPEPFQFYFRMQEYSNKSWTISLADGNDDDDNITKENDYFSIKVEKSDNKATTGNWSTMTITNNSFTTSSAGELYKVSITPKGPLANAATTTANVIITYYASWLGGNDHLLINSGGGGTLWSHSGHERHQILVTQGADITN
ncbi:MAG: hypothetical protein IJE52_07470 [Bacteroidales bacterium]|nr:hypothetical protein [Bacteroidales bacterium]